jgi:glycosyltransferase involved in cell wall biosynthesis
MKIILDAGRLGNGLNNIAARSGVFRVVDNLAKGLAQSKNIKLYVTAYEAISQTVLYLEQTEELKNVPFVKSRIGWKLYEIEGLITEQLSTEPNYNPFFFKILRKFIHSLNVFGISEGEGTAPKILKEADIFHSTFTKIPDDTKKYKNLKRFLTLYDMIPILHPEYVSNDRNHPVVHSVASVDDESWVVAISEYSKQDFCEYKKFDTKRVIVTPLAADRDKFYPCQDTERIETIKKKYNIPAKAPYFLGLSALAPHKNIAHTLKCFFETIKQEKINDLYFVLVGHKAWDYDYIFKEIENTGLKDRVIVTGYIKDEDLAPLYSGALAFFFMSIIEGFGLPPLEAMQCGTPAVTSNTSSLPEVVGNAGLMASPYDKETLCGYMSKLYNDSIFRADLSKKVLVQASLFSWEKFTQDTINAYQYAIQHG